MGLSIREPPLSVSCSGPIMGQRVRRRLSEPAAEDAGVAECRGPRSCNAQPDFENARVKPAIVTPGR